MKACAILVVLWIHSMHAPWEPGITTAEIWLGYFSLFAVPTFIFCSGYLHAAAGPSGASGSQLRSRLVRLVVPYLLASVAAQVFTFVTGTPRSAREIALDLVLASSFGPYYYVLLALLFVLLAPVVQRLPGWGLWALFAVAFAIQSIFEGLQYYPLSFFWMLRNPFIWLPYYLLGWIVMRHAPGITAFVERNRSTLLAISLPAAGGLPALSAALSIRPLAWIGVYAWIVLLYTVFLGRASLPGWLRRLSVGSYLFYLFHLFFIYTMMQITQRWEVQHGLELVALYWGVAVLGCVLLNEAVQKIFGARARLLFGA